MPVKGSDIVRLGVPPSPLVGTILEQLRVEFERTNASRDKLLAMAISLIENPR